MRPTRTTFGWLALSAAVLGAAAAWPQPASQPVSPATATDGAAAPAVAASTGLAVADPATVAAAAAATPHISFPDGTTRPVLNGVEEPVVLSWPSDTPYAPVVATVHDQGVDWFQHQDGSWSTTMRRLDSATGKYVTVCPLFQPAAAKPAQLRGQ